MVYRIHSKYQVDHVVMIQYMSDDIYFAIENNNETILDLKKVFSKIEKQPVDVIDIIDIRHKKIIKDDFMLKEYNIHIKDNYPLTLTIQDKFNTNDGFAIINGLTDDGKLSITQSITPIQVYVIADLLKTNGGSDGRQKIINTLFLDNCNIDKEGLMILVESLRLNTTLTKLYLSGNHIGDTVISVLSSSLKENTTLKELILDHNEIGYEGAMSLASLLRVNNTLNELFLNHNYIGNKGSMMLSEALRINTSLAVFYLNDNNITDEGTMLFRNALCVNTTLKHFSI